MYSISFATLIFAYPLPEWPQSGDFCYCFFKKCLLYFNEKQKHHFLGVKPNKHFFMSPVRHMKYLISGTSDKN